MPEQCGTMECTLFSGPGRVFLGSGVSSGRELIIFSFLQDAKKPDNVGDPGPLFADDLREFLFAQIAFKNIADIALVPGHFAFTSCPGMGSPRDNFFVTAEFRPWFSVPFDDLEGL